MSKSILRIVLIISPIFVFGACQNYASNKREVPKDSTYFSIRQFEADQVQLYSGQPFSLFRIAYLNNEKDSTIVNFLNMDWASIFRYFSATDISDPKFLGHYSFSAFDDETTGNRSYTYTALDEKLFTRLLQINTDPLNDKITSIYIETTKKHLLGSTNQKLLYAPLRVIQIQESVYDLFGSARNLRIDYRFMKGDEFEN